MKNTFYISVPAASRKKPQEIPQDVWDKITQDITELISSEYTPHDLVLTGHKSGGSPVVDTNLISISPPSADSGSDFVLKRVGTKLVTQVKTNEQEWSTIVAACCLVVKKHLAEAEVTNKLSFEGIKKGLQYFHYVLETNAPVAYPAQAENVVISFKWLEETLPEDCQQALDDIRTLLRGYADDISIRFDS